VCVCESMRVCVFVCHFAKIGTKRGPGKACRSQTEKCKWNTHAHTLCHIHTLPLSLFHTLSQTQKNIASLPLHLFFFLSLSTTSFTNLNTHTHMNRNCAISTIYVKGDKQDGREKEVKKLEQRDEAKKNERE
jgi:hypothetical protein